MTTFMPRYRIVLNLPPTAPSKSENEKQFNNIKSQKIKSAIIVYRRNWNVVDKLLTHQKSISNEYVQNLGKILGGILGLGKRT